MDVARLQKLLTLTTIIGLTLWFSASQSNADRDRVIRIGMIAPLTGPTSESGIALRQGAEFAVNEINAAGGINLNGTAYTLNLFVEDNEGKPEVGISAAERLISREKVHYLIGDAILSSVTMAIMELAPKYNIPIVSGESVSEAIVEKVMADPEKYRYYWKMNFGSTAYAHTVFNTVTWLIDTGKFQPHKKRVFFIVEDTDYGRSNSKEAARLFEEVGWSTVATETVSMGHTEFYAQLNKLREADTDVLVSIFTPLSSGVALVKQFQELGVDALHIAIYYPSRPEFLQQVGEAAEGLLWTPLIFDPEHIDTHKGFATKIRKTYNVEPTLDHAYGYDAVYNAVDSIRRANSLEPNDIIRAVSTLDYKGVVGRYLFEESTHQVKAGPEFMPIPTAQIQKGRNLIVWPVQFATSEYRPQSWGK